jgi:D-3-phosphoglycerate dehydrogenase
VTRHLSGPGLLAAIADANGVLVRAAHITREVIEAAPALEVVSRHGVGYDAVDVEALTERGIPLTITPAANAVSVAEHAMFQMLALAKRCQEHDACVREGRFGEGRMAMRAADVHGKTLLIVGFGRIGSLVAPRALGFGMRVLACDPYIDPAVIEAAGCTPVADFRAVLPEVDVLTVHTPLTAQTRAMVGAAELAAMKPTALVLNTARGGIVDEDALAAALGAGRLAGAGVDVFEDEPGPPDIARPLFARDNVIFSPHIAGVSLEAGIRMGRMSVQNVLDCFDGCLSADVVVNKEVLVPAARRA